MSMDTLDWMIHERQARRRARRPLGWRALRLAVRLGYEVERERESGYYRCWSPKRRDWDALEALGWEWSEGPMMYLEGR